MTDKREFEQKFWKAIRSDMTVMVGVDGVDPRPLTAQFDGERKPIYFFTAKDTELGAKVGRSKKSTLTFSSKGHDLFATVHGTLKPDNDSAVIDRLWNRFVAAWFEKGKDDPKMLLLRFDATEAQVWLDASSLVAGAKMFLGLGDPKKDYKDKTAELNLR